MKYFACLFFFFLVFTSCDSDDPCFGKSGKTIFKTIELPAFNQIDISKGFTVEIIESTESKIEISSYENYISNLDFKVFNNQLFLSNLMSCSLFHSYEIAKVRIYTPTLNSIKSRTQLKVSSVGILKFPELYIVSSIDGEASSSFDLKVENNVLKIEDNQMAWFKIEGSSKRFEVNLYGGSGRVNAESFLAYDCSFFQRSNNDILIRVENSLNGTIYATGNVVLFNKPREVNVDQKYKGKLIYN